MFAAARVILFGPLLLYSLFPLLVCQVAAISLAIERPNKPVNLGLGSKVRLILQDINAHAQHFPFLNDNLPPMDNKLTLTDYLTIESKASMFYDYLRQFEDISTRLQDTSQFSTVFAPQNSAIMKLQPLPHRNSDKVAKDDDVRTQEENRKFSLQEWVKSHIVLEQVNDSDLGSQTRSYETWSSSSDQNITISLEDNKEFVVGPGNLHVVQKRVATNGILYILEDVIKY